jgi:cell wall-associated NlpC family hydrolase
MVQLTFNLNGVNLPRDADQQFQVGEQIEVDELEPADLLFFSNKSSGITHVGIFIGEGRFLHSSGKASGVTITPLKDRFFQSVLVAARRVWPS